MRYEEMLAQMKLFSREKRTDINEDDPFANDKFKNYTGYSDILQLIKSTETPFVYAINAQWGAGKTTFIEMCSAELNQEGYTSFIINVWADNHLLETRELFLNHIAEIIRNLDVFETVKKKTKSFVSENKKIITTIASVALKIYFRSSSVGVESLLKDLGIKRVESKELGTDVSQVLQEIVLSKHSRVELLHELRQNLQKIVDRHLGQKGGQDTNKPIIIFIDELDRCLPNNVINFLDNLKHIFELRNVIFFLSIDLEQLTHSVQKIFGQNYSAQSYLDRFINAYYHLDQSRFLSSYFCDLMREQSRPYVMKYDLGHKYGKELRDFIGHIDDYIIGFRLSIRDLTWLSNFVFEYILTNHISWLSHLDYIVFAKFYKKKFSVDYQKYFVDGFELLDFDKVALFMGFKVNYFEVEYFNKKILSRYMPDRIMEPIAIATFAEKAEETTYYYNRVVEQLRLTKKSKDYIDRKTFFNATKKYLSHET